MAYDGLVNAAAAISWGSALLGGAKYVIGSSLFDIRQASADKQAARKPYSRALRQRPLVSIYIFVSDATTDIERCLAAIRGSGYRKYEIIITERTPSTPATLKKLLRAAKGELILFLRDDELLVKNSLKNAVNYLKLNDSGVAAVSTGGVWQLNLKSVVSQLESAMISVPAAKLTAMRGLSQPDRAVLSYKANLMRYKQPGGLEGSLTALKKLLAASWAGLFGYFTYLAIAHQFPLPLALFVASALLFAGLMVMAQPGLNLAAKLNVLVSLPGGLGLLAATLIARQLKKASTFIFETFYPVKLFKRS